MCKNKSTSNGPTRQRCRASFLVLSTPGPGRGTSSGIQKRSRARPRVQVQTPAAALPLHSAVCTHDPWLFPASPCRALFLCPPSSPLSLSPSIPTVSGQALAMLLGRLTPHLSTDQSTGQGQIKRVQLSS